MRGSPRAVLALLVSLAGCASTTVVPSALLSSSSSPSAVPAPPSATPPAATRSASGTSAAQLGPGEHGLTVQGQPAVVVVPARSNGGLVLYLHGLSGTAAAVSGEHAVRGLVPGLVEQGYTVAGSDAFGNAWGNPASVDSYAALAATVRRIVPVQRVYLLAESMGGLAAAQLVTHHRIPGLRAYAGVYPLCDLRSVYADFAASVQGAWGTQLDQALVTLSPVALGGAVPVLIWASPQDTVVDKERNADVCAAEAIADGGTATVVRTHGDHGDPSNFDLDALLAFYAAA